MPDGSACDGRGPGRLAGAGGQISSDGKRDGRAQAGLGQGQMLRLLIQNTLQGNDFMHISLMGSNLTRDSVAPRQGRCACGAGLLLPVCIGLIRTPFHGLL
ncbi:hypothetical protein O0880_12490 [Janthinobacterium sp. SUN118]|uniref:hypothetical protein n=1 Tax=Janthinobacterium sp. SUN118 TaxID=3004100 RepID=UPI0025B1DBC2|nr:hypothetical protein [Janthinobacterium sp. SUN118]MDN2710239.1 hypothetical protein [Janthinobacterium sp. SUN118]